jgi:chemotaxis protein methyltransferase CheR
MPEQPPLPPPLLAGLTEFLAAHTGLDFGGMRKPDLERAIRAAARLRHSDVESFVRELLTSPMTQAQVEALASHLTVGETYFFREKEALAALETHVLPPLLASRARGARRLRLWSAGCSTGEEPYSLAITLLRAVPELRDWNVSILATDINPIALRKAAAGIYGAWSFRNTPADLKRDYFHATGDGRWQVSERVRSMVSFDYLNLAQDSYPSVLNATNAMDAIFCRNVLMYFEPARAARVLEKLALCLLEEAWLFLNAIEVSRLAHPSLRVSAVAGTFAYRKATASMPPQAVQSLPPIEPPLARPAAPPARAIDESRPAPATPRPADDPAGLALRARDYANQGRLAEAQAWCEKAVAADKLNPARHYLLASILQEQGMGAQCESALQRALYLDPNHALAHFALGNLKRHQGKHDLARRHLRNALAILGAFDSAKPLPESDGLSAGRLAQIVRATLASEAVE